jgi:two-component system KDP operon response regulator KdpE
MPANIERFNPQGVTILVVDDEPRLRDVTRLNLEMAGFQVVEAATGYEAIERMREALPDLIILDVMMPEMDGFTALKEIREVSTVPVIMLTVRNDERDRIHGLDLGADDYMTKPFSTPELLSRVKAVLRRTFMPAPTRRERVVVDDDLTIDFDHREVLVRGERVTLRPTEARLLYHLVANAGHLLTHNTLLAKVWGREYRDENHYVRLYITYLRQKIERDPAHPDYILTERGMGYRFKEFTPQTE